MKILYLFLFITHSFSSDINFISSVNDSIKPSNKDQYYSRKSSFIEKIKFKKFEYLNNNFEIKYEINIKNQFLLTYGHSKYFLKKDKSLQEDSNDQVFNLPNTSLMEKNSGLLMFNYLYKY